MSEWNTQTGGEVYFQDLSKQSWWYQFRASIFLADRVILNTKNLTSAAGNSTVGAHGYSSLNIDSSLVVGKSSLAKRERTALHELGHTLGLEHEHQHWDRDAWVIVTGKGSNYKKVDHYYNKLKSKWTWQRVKIKRGWFKFYIWKPTFTIYFEQAEKFKSRGFDCESIMLYNGLQLKRDCPDNNQFLSNGTQWTNNFDLSQGDINGVQQMY